MKILFVSDTVMPQLESATNLRRRYNEVELVVSCGDMPSVYLEFIVSILNVPLFYVRGNHDERYDDYPPGGEDLHGKVIRYNGLTFAGLEGCLNYNNGKIQYTETQMLGMVMRMGTKLGLRRLTGKRPIDVFVTHAPPRGIHDAKDLPHTGFKAYLRFLEWYRPRYMAHGHVHTYDRRKAVDTQHLDTRILNINPLTILNIEPVK